MVKFQSFLFFKSSSYNTILFLKMEREREREREKEKWKPEPFGRVWMRPSVEMSPAQSQG
jgi:hypothetical protein